MSEEVDLSLLQELMEAGRDPNDVDLLPKPQAEDIKYLEFEIQQHVLSTLLKKANHAIPMRDWQPVLRNFLIMVIPGRMRIIASTGEFTTILETTMVTTINPGMALLPSSDLLNVVRVASAGNLKVRIEEERAVLSSERVKWEIPLHVQPKYPDTPDLFKATLCEVDRQELLRAIESVRYVVCTDTTRPSLRMIQIHGGRVTASDGDRFQQTSIGIDLSIKIPADAVTDVVRILNDSTQETVLLGEAAQLGKIVLQDAQDVYWFNSVKASFGDAENFLLKPALYNNRELIVDKQDLLTAIRHVRGQADSKTDAVGMFLTKSQMAVSARNPEGGKATEFIDATWTGGRERVIVVNHIYLTEMLKMHTIAECRFLLGDDSKSKRHPLLLRDESTGTVGLVQQMHSGRAVYDRLD